MPARLVALNNGPVPSIQVQRPVLLVGRHPECDVRIDLPQISRRHCCVALAYDRIVVRDLGSRHGLRVNGRLVDEARIEPGDEIAIGHLIYRLEAGPEPVARPQAGGAPPPAPQPPRADDDDDDLIPLDDL